MRISGRVLIVAAIIITVISALFCIISLSTKGWIGDYGLFCEGCYKAPAALSIISFILLIVSVIALVLQMFGFINGALEQVPILILFIATFFLLATFTSHVEKGRGYSFDLMVVAHFFSYVALAVMAYWLGQANATST